MSCRNNKRSQVISDLLNDIFKTGTIIEVGLTINSSPIGYRVQSGKEQMFVWDICIAIYYGNYTSHHLAFVDHFRFCVLKILKDVVREAR
jgi:hypothetical protein